KCAQQAPQLRQGLDAAPSLAAPCRRKAFTEGRGCAWTPEAAVMVVPARLNRASPMPETGARAGPLRLSVMMGRCTSASVMDSRIMQIVTILEFREISRAAWQAA